MEGLGIGPRRAYPRERGGNEVKHKLTLDGKGLSPRARGKRIGFESVQHLQGPIPASAGETQFRRSVIYSYGAYPRERGGNSLTIAV